MPAPNDDELPPTDPSAAMQKSPRTMYLDMVKSRATVPRKELPRMSFDDPEYSSTLMMLKKTKAEVEEYSASLGAANAIVDLPTTESVRKVIARMFSDPKAAEAVSEAEWKKREQAFQQSREKFGARVTECVRRDKDILQQELAKMSDGSSTGGGHGN